MKWICRRVKSCVLKYYSQSLQRVHAQSVITKRLTLNCHIVIHLDKYDIAQNTGTILVEQKQPYDKHDIAQNTGAIPVEQKQHYDKYHIVQNTGTIPLEQKQPYDKYDIAQNTGTIHVTQEHPYQIIRHCWTSKALFVMHSVINHLFTRTTNENEMDLSSREKFCSKILFTVPARGFMHNQ